MGAVRFLQFAHGNFQNLLGYVVARNSEELERHPKRLSVRNAMNRQLTRLRSQYRHFAEVAARVEKN